MKDSALVQDLVFLDNREVFTDSLIVAREFGKQHKHVLRDIEKLQTQLVGIDSAPKFGLANYIDFQGKERPKYHLSKDALTLLVMGYSTKKAMKIKIAYINEFNRMQRYIQLKEKREEIEEKERISAENGSDSGRDLQRRKVEKKANRKALSELDKELASFGIFELEPTTETIRTIH